MLAPSRRRRDRRPTVRRTTKGIRPVAVESGAIVEEGQLVCVIEAMKTENGITAHKAGAIATFRSPSARPSRPAIRSP
jgi:biotin carboxyl carrier protein